MLVEDMAVATVANMLRSPIRADTLAFVLAADMVTILPDRHAVMHAMQGAHITRLAAVTGEVVTGEVVDTGEVVIGIRTMDIPGLGYIYPYYGYYGYPYYGYYPWGYYPYRYGFWPYWGLSFGVTLY